MALRLGIIGLGRIGRGVLRANFAQIVGGRFDLCVISDVMPIDQVAYLLENDSTYGKPPFSLEYIGDDLILGGKKVHYVRGDRRRGLTESESFNALRALNLDVILDATGTASIADLQMLIDQHISKKTLCTSNIAGIDLSLIFGVNDHEYNPEQHHIISASTCTGNAFIPVAAILDKHIGINFAHIVTIHPALSDQRVLDGYHAIPQLGRTCAASIVPTSTNVDKSATLVLPSLIGKLSSISYRVPTAIVSAMDIALTLSRDTSREECTELFEQYAKTSLAGIIHCEYGSWGHQRVSIDYIGSEYSSIILMHHLEVVNGRHLNMSLMHDNEQAYCYRVLDTLGVISQRMA